MNVAVSFKGSLIMSSGEVAGNKARSGGGVAVGEGGSATIQQADIHDNEAAIAGGGIAVAKDASLSIDGDIYDNKITATITTKQDRHPNSGNLAVPFQNGKAPFRYLTPRECFLLMGFKEEEYDRILDNNFKIKKNSMLFTRDNLIKMAGNSIAVNVLSAIFHQIVHLDEMLFV